MVVHGYKSTGLEPPTIDEAPSTLPGEEKNLKLPQEVIERLKTTVFGFDTFWVTRWACLTLPALPCRMHAWMQRRPAHAWDTLRARTDDFS